MPDLKDSGSSASIWILGVTFAALAIVSAETASWWVAGIGSALGLGLTAWVARRSSMAGRQAVQTAREAFEQLDAAKAELEALSLAVHASPLPLAAFGPDKTTAAASESFARLAGRPANKIAGLDIKTLLGPEAAEAAQKADALEGTQTVTVSGETIRVYSTRTGGGAAVVLAVPCAREMAEAEHNRNKLANFHSASQAINELAQRMAGSSELMSAYADEQATGANRQKQQTEAVAGAIDKMMSAVMEVATNASATSEAASEAREVAVDGTNMVHKAVEGINTLATSAKELAEVLAGLDTQAGEIGRVIGVISDIADQTNLLALNAAIEAARAGDAGRGFAVVADEVRKLAEKTMQATGEVESAVRNIQASSKEAMTSMDRTGRMVEESTDLSNQAGQALEKVMEHIEGMVDRVHHIAQAAEEQSAAAEQISASVEEIASIARDSDEGATQQAYATKDIATLSAELLGLAQGLSGKEGKSLKIAKSEGLMKGVLPKLMQDYIKDEFGPDTFEAVQEELGDPTFLPGESYPDTVLHQMADLVSAATGTSKRDVLYGLGLVTVNGFHKLYKRYFRTKDLKEFYMSMNDVHAEVTKDMPGVKPPKFTFEDKGDTLFMNYTSPRALFDYFEGILNGAARFFDQKIDVRIKPLNKDTARAEIHFLECDSKTECNLKP
ncbi:methyl-accepting chemotaxis protein [Desulfovibrio ferrophilus]|uniref:Methyl-accepting chemotaxis sensory transducer with HNOB (Heme) sensor n=1 Tax=Desulfovibrio ferrophilus TaxID=241368 RepID=A0A2Z6B0W6_9BACT|nr:methyl-accepting chemotaxis protein [Desulfovibrio ferrophilus]BBD09046.1 methyl-accepting chemotaxis sensory transducer with HNOB (Heme) sensor [Desulfovibrio ferrophilus]